MVAASNFAQNPVEQNAEDSVNGLLVMGAQSTLTDLDKRGYRARERPPPFAVTVAMKNDF